MTTLRDVMTADVVTVEPGMSLRDAIEVLRKWGVSGAPVVASGRVLGVVSATDLLEFEATEPGVPTDRPGQVEWGELEPPDTWQDGEEAPARYFVDMWSDVGTDVLERFSETDGPEWDILEEHAVHEVMTRTVVTLPPDATVQRAAQEMVRGRLHRLLVMENSHLVGIVSASDIVRLVAEGRV